MDRTVHISLGEIDAHVAMTFDVIEKIERLEGSLLQLVTGGTTMGVGQCVTVIAIALKESGYEYSRAKIGKAVMKAGTAEGLRIATELITSTLNVGPEDAEEADPSAKSAG